MNGYIRPKVIRTYSIAELVAGAVECTQYITTVTTAFSDRNLKRDIEMIDQPLARLGAISKI